MRSLAYFWGCKQQIILESDFREKHVTLILHFMHKCRSQMYDRLTQQLVYYKQLLSVIRCTIITNIMKQLKERHVSHTRRDMCRSVAFIEDKCGTTWGTQF